MGTADSIGSASEGYQRNIQIQGVMPSDSKGGPLLREMLKEPTGLILLIGVVALAAASLSILTGNSQIASGTFSISAIAMAFIMAVLGAWLFVRQGLLSDDKFHMLHTNLSIALIFFGLSEIAITAVAALVDSMIYQIVIGLIQLIGVILWAEGAILYLYATNSILDFSDRRLIVPFIIILSALPYLGIQSFMSVTNMVRSDYLLVAVPLEIGLTIVFLSLLIILWHFRGGFYAKPILLSLAAILLLLTRTVLWCSDTLSLSDVLSQSLAVTAYWLLGFSLLVTYRGEVLVDRI
jgi:hypothetical protein